jgi:hypothetical protein
VFLGVTFSPKILSKMFWAIFSQTHLVTLLLRRKAMGSRDVDEPTIFKRDTLKSMRLTHLPFEIGKTHGSYKNQCVGTK